MTSNVVALEALKVDQAKPVTGQEYQYQLSLKDIPNGALARIPPTLIGTNEDRLQIFIGEVKVYETVVANDPPSEIKATIPKEKFLQAQGVHDMYYVIYLGGGNPATSKKEKYFITL
jgi:hypothetical protein